MKKENLIVPIWFGLCAAVLIAGLVFWALR